jgi:DNA repair exonuclease SbcCD nuclease subunit
MMPNVSDAELAKKLTAEAEKLDGESSHKKLRALHRRLNRAEARLLELSNAEDKEQAAKNQPFIDELKKRIPQIREEIRTTVASSDRAKRARLRRVSRKLRKITKPTFEERQKSTQKQLDIISKQLADMTKGMKKVQANAYVHSLRKKVKSLNKKIKRFARIQKKMEAAKPAEAAK